MATPPTPKPKPTITILPAPTLFSIAPKLGYIAATTYFPFPFEEFLAPYRHQHPNHHMRGYTQRIQQRLLDPSVFTFVAFASSPQAGGKSEPAKPVGYIQFQRLGDDAGYQKVVNRYSPLSRHLRKITARVLDFLFELTYFPFGNRAESTLNIKTFRSWGKEDAAVHWDEDKYPERRNRYHVRSLVVLEEYHRLGIGRGLIGEVVRRAGEEKVCVGLESSVMGEGLYRSVGFVVLGRFKGELKGEEVVVVDGKRVGRGGILAWFPEGWEGETRFIARVDEEGNVDI